MGLGKSTSSRSFLHQEEEGFVAFIGLVIDLTDILILNRDDEAAAIQLKLVVQDDLRLALHS